MAYQVCDGSKEKKLIPQGSLVPIAKTELGT